ncbi:AraC family transcriptional regulator [Enterocloster citroniae]|uniref:AraC family transcriptional regulator n=1 Tax=Enterocloster citroniae TaxID=358743 RepID=UPI002E75B5A0|nr:AraC family transcriptional regulator [Enterocloster citroniae]
MADVYLKSANIYRGDYSCILYSRDYEFTPGGHYHDFYEVQFYLQDAGSILIGDQEYPLRGGDIVFLNIFQPHYVKLRNDGTYYKRFCISLDSNFLLQACTEETNLLQLFHSENNRYPILAVGTVRFNEYVSLLLKYEQLPQYSGSDIMLRSIIYEILSDLYRDFTPPPSILDTTDTQTAAVIAKLITYISEHINEDLSLDFLSEHFFYSKYHLCRVFRKYTGKTLNVYINEKRIDTAKQYLTTDLSIRDVCRCSGYHNYSYFYKTFLKIVGIGPSEYRQASLEGQKK